MPATTIKPGSVLLTAHVRKTPNVCGGDTCVDNSRIAVWMLEEARRMSMSMATILELYPSLTEEGVLDAWKYAREYPEEIEEAITENNAI